MPQMSKPTRLVHDVKSERLKMVSEEHNDPSHLMRATDVGKINITNYNPLSMNRLVIYLR